MDAIVGALKSKTMWFAVLGILLSTLAAPVQEWIAANPGIAGALVSSIFAVLRMLTTTSLSAKGAGDTTPSA